VHDKNSLIISNSIKTDDLKQYVHKSALVEMHATGLVYRTRVRLSYITVASAIMGGKR